MSIRLEVSLYSPETADAPRVTVRVAVDLEEALAREPNRLQERIAQLVRLAQQALPPGPDDARAAPVQTGSGSPVVPPAAPPGQEAPRGYRAYPGVPSQAAGGTAALVRLATVPQVRAIVRLAQERKLHLGPLLQERFHVRRLEELTRQQASALIGLLKSGRDPFIAAFFPDEEGPQGGPEEPGKGG